MVLDFLKTKLVKVIHVIKKLVALSKKGYLALKRKATRKLHLEVMDLSMWTDDGKEELKEHAASLKNTLIGLNRGIAAKQEEIDQLSKRREVILAGGVNAQEPSTSRSASSQKTQIEVAARNNAFNNEMKVIFPIEIWTMVLAELTDRDDQFSCSRTCPLFDRILNPAKPKFLFPQIFKALYQYLDKKEILDCRQVCKDWNYGVDHFLENHPTFSPFDEGNLNPTFANHNDSMKIYGSNLNYVFTNCNFSLWKTHFLDRMRNHTRNPIVGRAVTILTCTFLRQTEDGELPDPNFLPWVAGREFTLGAQELTFWYFMRQLLVTFGNHIWYLNFDFSRRLEHSLSQSAVLSFLTGELFQLTPNLRRLKIDGVYGDDSPPGQLEMFRPFPPGNASRLHALDVGGISLSVPGFVSQNIILHFYGQINELHIGWTEWEKKFSRLNLTWFNLTELHLTNLDDEIDTRAFVGIRMPRLEKLGLTSCDPNEGRYSLETIMNIILELSATTRLRVLRLNRFGGFIGDDDECPADLFAPRSLKTLEFEQASAPWVFLDFLLRFPSLENLSIFQMENNWDEDNYDEEGFLLEHTEIIGLYMDMTQKEVYECNIWEFLPKLKVLTYQEMVCTREGYEQFVLQNRRLENAN